MLLIEHGDNLLNVQKMNREGVGFPFRLFPVAFILTIFAFGWLGWIIFDTVRDGRLNTEKMSRVDQLRGVIVHLDEVLTMSARMAAQTGDSRWEKRYKQFEPKLNAAIQETMKIGKDFSGKEVLTTMAEANFNLVEMEQRAFTLISEGRHQEAMAVLMSPEYETQKSRYSEGTSSFVSQLRREFDENIRKNSRKNLLSIIAATMLCVISFVGFVLAFRNLQRWRFALERTSRELTQAAQGLSNAHAELEVRVQHRTAELAATNKALQEEIAERNRMEVALQGSEARTNAIVQSSLDGIITIDHEGMILEFNPAAEVIFGYQRSKMLGMDLAEVIIPPAMREEYRYGLMRYLATGKSEVLGKRFEFNAVRSDGTEFLVELAITRLGTEEPPTFTGFVRDITEYKRAEEVIRASEEKFRQLATNITEVFWICSPDLQKMHYVSPAYELIWGRSAESLYANPQNFAEAIFPEDRENVFKDFTDTVAGKSDRGIDYRMMRPDGEMRWIHAQGYPVLDDTGKVIRVTGIATDITERKRTEQALQVSETRYRTLFEANPFPMWVYDLATLSFLEINDAAIAHYGYSREEFLSMTIADIRPPADRSRLLENVAQAAESILHEAGVWKHQKKDGSIIDVEIRSHLFDYDGRNSRLVLAHDISEVKQIEIELRESNEKFQQLADNITDAFWIRSPDARELHYISPAFDRIWGRSSESLYENPEEWTEFILPVDRERVLSAFADLTGESRSLDIEYRIVRPDGQIRWVRVRGFQVRDTSDKLIRLTGIVTDITESHRVTEELRESERRYSIMMQNLELVSMMLDKDARITYCNDYLLRLSGWERKDLIGRDWFEVFIPPDMVPEMRGVISALLADQPVAWHHENEIMTRSGERRLIRWNNSVLRSASGEAIGTASIGEDITERKRLESKLFQSQKMETVGKLAGGVAHEFNSILTAIIGQSELLVSGLSLTSPLIKNATEIRKSAGRAATLTQQLLAFGRKQLLEPETFDLNQIISSLKSMFQHLLGGAVQVRIVLATQPLMVRADAEQIEQVILNLALNAREAMPGGGKLTLETGNVTLDAGTVGGYAELKPGNYVMLGMTDTGMGMTPEIQASLFEPFFTTKRVGQGTGLGLAASFGIIKQSGGHISVYSELDHGTTFKVYLPEVASLVEAGPQLNHSTGLPSGTEIILLVEDDSGLREMVAELLRRLGYIVLVADSGLDALNIMEQQGEESIDLLFTDVVMPNMNGKELSDRILASHPKIKTLFTSAYTENAIAHQGILDPGVTLLQKPFTPTALALKVREVLDQPVIKDIPLVRL